MTDEELRAYVTESRARQGLPPTVTDPVALERVAIVRLSRQLDQAEYRRAEDGDVR